MNDADPALKALFLEEIQRHVQALQQLPPSWGGTLPSPAASRLVHAMRGAAAMMGLADVSTLLGEIEVSFRHGRPLRSAAFVDLDRLLRQAGFAADGLLELRVPNSSFPPTTMSSIPPFAGAESSVSSERPALDPEVLEFFVSEARARVETLRSVMDRMASPQPREAVEEAFSHVHAVKGAAATVGLVAITRATHAVESALATLRGRLEIDGGIHEAELEALRTARSQLATILTTPTRARRESAALVDALRAIGLVSQQDIAPMTARKRNEPQRPKTPEAIRIPAELVTQLAERVSEVGVIGSRVAESAGQMISTARSLQRFASELDTALRKIGPPRPWGAPADALRSVHAVMRGLETVASNVASDGESITHNADLLGALSSDGSNALKGMSACTMSWVFERVAPAVEALARSENKDVIVLRDGEGIEIPRSLAERLVEPCVQIVRNAVTHGLEPPARRLSRGKPARGTIRLNASIENDRLIISIEDDGAGVDLPLIARRAQKLGLLREEDQTDPQVLLATLFLPGISSRMVADDAAGRGVGLDLVYREISLLGGVVTAHTKTGQGTRFDVSLPMRQALARVLVVRAGKVPIGVPLERVMRVWTLNDLTHDATLPTVSLHDLLGESRPSTGSGMHVQLSATQGPVALSVDEVEHVVPVMRRPMPTLLSGLRPWSGVSIDGEGRVMLLLEPDHLAARGSGPT